MPNSITECSKGKTFEINEKTVVCSTFPQGSFIIDELKQIISNRIGVRVTEQAYRKNNRIELAIDSTINGKEHYILEVEKEVSPSRELLKARCSGDSRLLTSCSSVTYATPLQKESNTYTLTIHHATAIAPS